MAALFAISGNAGEPASDVLKTASGDLAITVIGHASLMLQYGNTVIHVDPFSRMADYAALPKADLILITHEHADHLDPTALSKIRTANTAILLSKKCAGRIAGGVVMNNGDVQTVRGIKVEAVPAYNIVHRREDGQPYHPRGIGNGYVMTFADKRVYVAGDTEDTPEMKALTDIDCAFLPMNVPYTMTPEMAANAAMAFKPKALYPYHMGETDASRLVELLKNSPGIEVRIRK